jgi:hypothetical protein
MLLEKITEHTRSGALAADDQRMVWDSLCWDKNDPDNKEMTKYLFTGWWIYNNALTADPK